MNTQSLLDKKIVVVIPTFGRSTLLERTLESLSCCEFSKELQKTIIIENGPKGDAELVCAKYKSSINCEYIYSEVANKSHALNEALKIVDSDSWIIFFDDDIRLSPEVIKAYSKVFNDDGQSFFYGGPVDVDYERMPSKYYALQLPFSARGWEHEPGKTLLPNHLLGCNWGVSKRNLQAVGFFNPNYGPNSTTGAVGQEHDMMFRLDQNGIKPKYIPDAKVWHYVPKERSSFKWALMRKFKMGVSYGLREKQLPNKNLSSEINKSLFSLTKALVKLNRTQAVQRLFKLYFLLGVRKGINIK